MLGRLAGFEIRYHTRMVGFWITVIIMFLLGVAIVSMPGVTFAASGERIKANGALLTAGTTASLSLLAMFFGATFVVGGLMRDSVCNALEMVHATAVRTRDMVLSRMTGVFVVTFLCIFALTIGLFAGQFMPWMDKDALGPVNVLYYVQPALLFIAVNTLFVSGFFTLIAATTRNRALVYVSAVGLFIAYTSASLFVGQDAPDLLTALIDPFGSSALGLTTQFWPSAEQNTHMAPLWGYVGLNRLLWGSIGLALYVASFALFRRGLVSGKGGAKPEADEPQAGRITIAPVTARDNAASGLLALWVRFKHEYLGTVKSIPFIVLTLMAVALFAITVFFRMKFLPSPSLPTSSLMATVVIGALVVPLLIMIVFFSGEIVWRDKTAAMNEILDASPVRSGALMAGKWLALMAMMVTLFAVGILFGVAAQMALGHIPVYLLTYLGITFVSFAPRILLFCALVLFVQNFMPGRVAGMLASGALVIFFFIAINFLPWVHPLMTYGAMGAGSWSEFYGFSDLVHLRWFGLYWGALAALFAVLGIWLWRRGIEEGLLTRLKHLRRHVSAPMAALAVLFALTFAGTGGWIYKAYNIDNDFLTQKQSELRQVAWEKLLGAHRNDILPKIRAVETRVSFSPARRSATIKGRYVIENTTGKPLHTLYLTMPRRKKADNRALTLHGARQVTGSKDARALAKFGTRLYRFDPPLAPGAKTSMTFETFVRAPGLGSDEPVLPNGTFINNTVVMPQLGVADRRLINPDKRRKYKLPKYEQRPDRTDMQARQNNFFGASADYVDFKATVCTGKDQIPIAPGKLVREYDSNGQLCRDYRAVRPIVNFFSFLSARYTVRRDHWSGASGRRVDLRIYYHHSHGYNVEKMLTAMQDALSTYSKTFGPYPYSQIRILEFPSSGFAQSFAGTIPFSENIGFVMNPGDPKDNKKLDLASYVTMHEIGHQWFGHQIVPASTKGFNVLSEGLTENAAMTAYEAAFGWQKARRVLDQRAIQTYLVGRTADRKEEPPLARAEGQQYLVYNKASWVFWGLKHYIGKDKMQRVIRGFLQDFGYKGPPYPTTLQLVAALRQGAGPQWQGLITDYWDRIVFWDIKFGKDITVKANPEGGYTVRLTALVDKKITDETTGKETSVSKIKGEHLNEWVEIGFYDHDPKKSLGDNWMKLVRMHITRPETAISCNLDKRPAYVVLDPRRLLIERDAKDNVKALPKDKTAAKP